MSSASGRAAAPTPVPLSSDFLWRPARQHGPEDALHRHHRPQLKDGKIVEEIGLDDGVTALTQLGLLRAV